jgi:hypothetical protein
VANAISHASLPYPIKHARYSVLVPFLNSSGVPTDPTTPDTEVSQDGGAFADTTEEVTTITGSNGMGFITLTGAEMNNAAVGVAFKASSGPNATLMTVYPRELPILSSGTLSAGSAGGGTLGTVLNYDVTGCFLRTTGGTGGGGTGGANNQARQMVTYTPSTGAFTVSPNWETTPSSDTTYDVLLPDGLTVGVLKALNPATAGRTLVVDANGLADANTVKVGPTGSGTAQTARDMGASVLLSNGTGTGQVKLSSGYVAPNWADVGSPTTTLNLSGTTLKAVTDAVTVGTNNDKTGYGLTAGEHTAIADELWDEVLSGHLTSGTTGAALNAAASAGDPWATALPGAYSSGQAGNIVGANLNATVTSRAVAGDAMALTSGERTTLTGVLWAALTTGLTTVGSIGKLLVDRIDAAITSRLVSGTVTVGTNNDKTGYALSSGERDAIAVALLDLVDAIEAGVPVRKALRAILAATGGKSSGGGTGTETFRNAVADSKNRLVATVDSNGNRSAITYDLT